MGILWIEDSFSEQEKNDLERRVAASGFIAEMTVIPNGERLDELAEKQRLYHVFDLILLDYKLKDEFGDVLAQRVRELFPYTTILFYSGTIEDDNLRVKIAQKCVEGVYCSHRDRFIQSAGSLIDQTAKALDRLSGMRGLAMRVVAECDTLMRSVLITLTERDKTCESLLGKLDESVATFMESSRTSYEKARNLGMKDRLDTRAVDSAKTFAHFRRLTESVAKNGAAHGLDDEMVDHLRELRRRSSKYETQILKRRNILGHANEIRSEDGWRLEGSDEIMVADFPDIRRDFASNIAAIRNICELLVPEEGHKNLA